MKGEVIWRIVLAVVAVYIAILLLRWVWGVVLGLAHMAIVLAIVVGIIWLLMALLGKRNRAY